jgi:hypothetical protein
MQRLYLAATATLFATSAATAQKLHVNPRWKECSFQLDSSLKQSAWHQFTQEAGVAIYFRSLDDARPLGKGKFEVSALQWQSSIDDSKSAWNDTFVHPDSTHWLTEGKGLKIPGLTVRAGIDSKTDVALYATKNPEANYGFIGGQLQRSLIGDATSPWNASARVSMIKMFGPADLSFAVYGAELVASRSLTISRRATLSPYAGVSSYLARAHERTDAVTLSDENVLGAQATAGAELRLFGARIAAEYRAAQVHGLSLKVGFGT